MSTFFIPGTGEDGQLTERISADLRTALVSHPAYSVVEFDL